MALNFLVESIFKSSVVTVEGQQETIKHIVDVVDGALGQAGIYNERIVKKLSLQVHFFVI